MQTAFKNYLNAELLVDDINENTDKSMREEYERMKKLRPVAKVEANGALTVSGILGEL